MWTRRAWALFHHYKVRALQVKSLLTEFLLGTIAFLQWIPRLSRNFSVIFFSRKARGLPGSIPSRSAEEIDGFFINLDNRQDRRRHVVKSLQAVGLTRLQRFPAIANDLGILGCTKSHIAVLEKAKAAGYGLTLICEDDLEFLRGRRELEKVVSEFAEHPALDVLCLAYRLRAPRLPVSRELAIGNSIQTASCYLVKFPAIDLLLQSLRESEAMLEDGVGPQVAANDMHWKLYQTTRLFFAIPRKRVGRQRPSYSDIAQRFKDYRA